MGSKQSTLQEQEGEDHIFIRKKTNKKTHLGVQGMVSSLGEGSRATSRLPTAGEVELMCSEQVRVLGQATVAFLFLKTTWLQKKSD